MTCPACKQAMEKVRSYKTYNPNENNKEYDHSVYHCEPDDIWVTVEIPAATAGNASKLQKE